MTNEIERLKEEIETLHARTDAHRAALTVLVTAIGDAQPGVRAEIMRGLAAFERGLRRTNERDAVLRELRALREILEQMGKPEGSGAAS